MQTHIEITFIWYVHHRARLIHQSWLIPPCDAVGIETLENMIWSIFYFWKLAALVLFSFAKLRQPTEQTFFPISFKPKVALTEFVWKTQRKIWNSILGVDAMPLSLKNLLLKGIWFDCAPQISGSSTSTYYFWPQHLTRFFVSLMSLLISSALI